MKDLPRINDVSFEYAITQMVDLTLSGGESEDKVLIVPIQMNVNDYEQDISIRKSLTIVAYRPSNYCFIGYVEGSVISISEDQEIKFMGYHDSCWRDAIGRSVREISSKLIDDVIKNEMKDVSVFTSFGFGAKILKGKIEMDEENRTAKFIRGTIDK